MEEDFSDSDDKMSSSDVSDESDSTEERQKRSVECVRHRPHITWPPKSSSSNWYELHHVRMGNPLFGTKMQLFSMTGYNLAVYSNHRVKGTLDDTDEHSFLELSSVNFTGHIRIKCFVNNIYIAMNSKGKLYGEKNALEESTVFIESFQGSYNTYLSRKYAHLGWYIGIKKSGKCKKGSKTKYGQKAIKFLPRRSRFEQN